MSIERISPRQECADRAKAAGLTPFILASAGVAALGGAVGLTGKQRVTAAGIAAILFIAI